MKTAPLSEVVAKATPLPLVPVSDERGVYVGRKVGERIPCVAPINTTDKREAKATAALLAHSPQALVQCVEALGSCLGPLQDEYNKALHTKHRTAAADAFLKARTALAFANAVPTP